ncbi:MAG: hypothetical protein KIT80_21050 [Chitinophagaceae bacterium]|nr:hypothetical protein [Chitinophagaceae bacterium]MCW5929422.1 hypothetical protein [Chitinophagaceae bacterium]
MTGNKLLYVFVLMCSNTFAQTKAFKSIRDFNVMPSNTAAVNKINLQKAIDWASGRGAALFVEPGDEPYAVDGGIILKPNVSLIGANGPVPGGTSHPSKKQPVGSVFKITDKTNPFITVESATQIRGIQFWYPDQTLTDANTIIPYPATIQNAKNKLVEGVYLSCLTFYGEYLAMDFNASLQHPVALVIFEHCYGYPLSGGFIRISHCYDIPRILHCHVNPALQRLFKGDYSPAVIDAVVAQKTYAYTIDYTDNAQLMDLFTFGTYGGIMLGGDTYGQLTNFNFDCVATGIYKKGSQAVNRNWQISQGSIISNTGERVNDLHPVIIEGEGHTSLNNVEIFSGQNLALTTVPEHQSWDYLRVRGNKKLTVTLTGCRMVKYMADNPISIENKAAVIQVIGCVDKNQEPLNFIINGQP